MTEPQAKIEELLKHLSDQLPQLDAETRGIQMYGAPRLNVFSAFTPDERRITSILADLLNPKGRHGQGALFLNAFLCALPAVGLPPVKSNEDVRVTVDAITSKGRFIDITVETPALLLGIEVKLWASQGNNQLEDYTKHLEERHGSRKWALVFLANQEPETAAKTVIRMPWANAINDKFKGRQARPFSEILMPTLGSIRASRARAFLEDFLAWVNDGFGAFTMNDEYKPHIDAVVKHLGSAPRAVGAVLLAQNALLEGVLNSIGEAVLKQLGDDYESEGGRKPAGLVGGWEWLLYRSNWPENLRVGLTVDKGRRIWGVKAPDPTSGKVTHKDAVVEQKLREALDKSFQAERPDQNSYWPWWETADGTWDSRFAGRILLEAPNGVIAEHREIDHMAKTLAKLAKDIDDIVAQLDWASD